MTTSERASPLESSPATADPASPTTKINSNGTSRALSVAYGASKYTHEWTQLPALTWSEFVAWLTLDQPARRKNCGGYVLGELQPTTGCSARDGGPHCTALHRNASAVVHRSALTLDIDYAPQGFEADSMTLLSCAVILYTTWSSTPEKPRWRLAAPLSRDVPPDEYRLVARAVVHDLELDQYDASTDQPERLMHRPSDQGYYGHHVVDGEPLDVEMWLARAKEIGIAVQPQREPYVDDSPLRDPALGLHPYVRASIAGELGMLGELGSQPWQPGAGWDQGTFNGFCNLIEFANSNWSGYTLEQAEADGLAHAPHDEVWGARDHDAKWDSALAKVGEKARPLPSGDAADVFAEPWNEQVAEPTGLLARFPRLNLRELLDPNRPEREYVVEPMIAVGTSVALVAPAGHRKSLLALGIGLAVARGDEAFAGMEIPRPRRVLYVDQENTQDDLMERLVSFGVTPDREIDNLIVLSLTEVGALDTAPGGKLFLQVVGAYGLERGDLVVLDSYQRITEAGENDSDTTRGYYRHTGMHLKARGLTVIRTDNTGKDPGRGARGSSGKRDDVDVEYLLKSEGDYIEVTTGKARQRGVPHMSLYVCTDDDGLTTFRSDLPSPAKARQAECVARLDVLGLPEKVGERKAMAALEDAGEAFPRAIVRVACSLRQARADQARQAFAGDEDGV